METKLHGKNTRKEINVRKYFSLQRITASLFLIARQSASALLLLWRKQKRQVL